MSSDHRVSNGVDRRHFLKLAAGAAAASGLTPGPLGTGTLLGQERPPGVVGQEAPPPVPLGNGEPPAFAFQAYPGGTGSLLEKLWRAGWRLPLPTVPLRDRAVEWSGPGRRRGRGFSARSSTRGPPPGSAHLSYRVDRDLSRAAEAVRSRSSSVPSPSWRGGEGRRPSKPRRKSGPVSGRGRCMGFPGV